MNHSLVSISPADQFSENNQLFLAPTRTYRAPTEHMFRGPQPIHSGLCRRVPRVDEHAYDSCRTMPNNADHNSSHNRASLSANIRCKWHYHSQWGHSNDFPNNNTPVWKAQFGKKQSFKRLIVSLFSLIANVCELRSVCVNPIIFSRCVSLFDVLTQIT